MKQNTTFEPNLNLLAPGETDISLNAEACAASLHYLDRLFQPDFRLIRLTGVLHPHSRKDTGIRIVFLSDSGVLFDLTCESRYFCATVCVESKGDVSVLEHLGTNPVLLCQTAWLQALGFQFNVPCITDVNVSLAGAISMKVTPCL